jgi:hypothetical protein
VSALQAGDVAGYHAALQTAREAADGVHEPQQIYRAAVKVLGLFVGELAALVSGVGSAEWTAVGGETGAEGVGVEVYLVHVKMRLRGLEEEERRLGGVAEMCLRVRGGES